MSYIKYILKGDYMNNNVEAIEVFKALSNDARLKILFWLKDPEANFGTERQVPEEMHETGVCVSVIRDKLEMTQSTTSQYLSVLQRAGLVDATRIGKWTYYKRNEEKIKAISEFLAQDL